jgi:hypothetical protein
MRAHKYHSRSSLRDQTIESSIRKLKTAQDDSSLQIAVIITDHSAVRASGMNQFLSNNPIIQALSTLV